MLQIVTYYYLSTYVQYTSFVKIMNKDSIGKCRICIEDDRMPDNPGTSASSSLNIETATGSKRLWCKGKKSGNNSAVQRCIRRFSVGSSSLTIFACLMKSRNLDAGLVKLFQCVCQIFRLTELWTNNSEVPTVSVSILRIGFKVINYTSGSQSC